jgi:nucleotide-binding universal stress UspA family protein
MRWLLGLDVRPSHNGAARFGQWLVRGSMDCNAKTSASDTLVGAHVVDRQHLDPRLRAESVEEFKGRAQGAVVKALQGLEAGDFVGDIEIDVDVDESKRLLELREQREADAIVVARARKNADRPRLHLGRVAHRLLSLHEAPVVVVPPDLSPVMLGDGPVILATDLEKDSADAGRFAVKFAEEHARSLVVCHVVPNPEETLAAYMPSKGIDETAHDHVAEATERFGHWCKAFGVDAKEFVVRMGEPVEEVIDLASEKHSPLIVTGTHGKSAIERFFIGSVANEIAGGAFCPVAVVPPSE